MGLFEIIGQEARVDDFRPIDVTGERTDQLLRPDHLVHSVEIDLAADLPDHIYVEVDRRFNVAIERTESGLEFRIYPRTAGELWDSPFTTFEVDEAEILELEKEIEQ